MTTRVQNYLEERVVWRPGASAEYPYEGELDGERLVIRVNDFPNENLYTLIVNDVEVASFDDWPNQWTKPNEGFYDVALSFAGEDRSYVEKVVEILKQDQIKVFYDRDEQVYLWGKDLGDALDEIYRLRSRYVVMFISEHYAKKMWTNHERKSALARALQEKQESVLPARFDDTQIPGLRPTVAYVDLRHETPDSFASMLRRKISYIRRAEQMGSNMNIQAPAQIPRKLEDVADHLIIGVENDEFLPFWKLFANEPPSKESNALDSMYEDVYFDDFNEMKEVFESIKKAVSKADESQKRGLDRQKAFERAWMDECISRASYYAMSKIGKGACAEPTKLPGFKYMIFGIHRDYARMIRALRTQEFLEGRPQPSRDAEEIYFKNITTVGQIRAAIEKAVEGSGGDDQEFMRLLFTEIMRLRTFDPDIDGG